MEPEANFGCYSSGAIRHVLLLIIFVVETGPFTGTRGQAREPQGIPGSHSPQSQDYKHGLSYPATYVSVWGGGSGPQDCPPSTSQLAYLLTSPGDF